MHKLRQGLVCKTQVDTKVGGFVSASGQLHPTLPLRRTPDTAHRDIHQDRIDKHILKKDAGGGRSTSYSLTASRLQTKVIC